MTSDLSNTLADLAERVREAQEEIKVAETTAATRALDAGRMLCEAKDQCRHGEWLRFLGRADMQERQAQRLMQIARSGLKADTVSELGGIKAALAYLAQRQLPAASEVLLISKHGWAFASDSEVNHNLARGTSRPPLAIIWPSADHVGFYEVTVIDFGLPDSVVEKMQQGFIWYAKRPVRAESIRHDDGSYFSGLWETVDRTLHVPHAQREFTLAPDSIEQMAKWCEEIKAREDTIVAPA